MLTLVDSVYISILSGLIFSGIVTLVFHLFAILTEVLMSGKSLVLSIIMFFCLWIFSSQIISGIRAKFNLYDGTDNVEYVYNKSLKKIRVEDARQTILATYPHLHELFDIVEVQDPNNAEMFIDDSQSTLNMNIWKRVGYLVASLLVLGIPAFLFGQRRMSYKERRNTRNNTSHHKSATQRSRYTSRRR